MSISPDFNKGVSEHLGRIINYLNPDGTGALADSLYSVRAIHNYALNIHDTNEMSFTALLRNYPNVLEAFGGFLNEQNMHDQEFFRSEEFERAYRNHNLVLETQMFLKSYKNQVVHSLENRKRAS